MFPDFERLDSGCTNCIGISVVTKKNTKPG